MKLSKPQNEVISFLREYPDAMLYSICSKKSCIWYATGGHGGQFTERTVSSLIKKGIIVKGKLSEVYR
jgi:hypothetical protein